MRRHNQSSGFTLIELLVAISVLLVLAALSLTASQRMRALQKKTSCLSNLRQIGVAMQLYANDHNQLICPRYDSISLKVWQDQLNDYLGNLPNRRYFDLPVWWCPSATRIDNYTRHYSVNIYVYDTSSKAQWQRRAVAPPTLSRYVLVGETNQNGEVMQVANASLRNNPDYTGEIASAFRLSHPSRSANYLFADGHVENRVGNQASDTGSNSIWRWWDD
jgi:prepilin-type N-terminal cleavage/methylation domain-containing protein/prepilin-type processing-associated H-X9-DG protein